MLRELAEALEVLTADPPLVLVLEDLQWSDHSTVEALAYLAQRPEPARLLVLGTYRPVEVLLQGHPLRGMVQELCGRGQAVELRLEFLPAADVAAYVAGRLGGPVAAPLAAFVYERTDGNALFMVNIVEHLVQQGLVVRRAGQWTLREGAEAQVASLPEGLRQLLLRRIEALPPEARRVLEAASVVGEEFAVAAVAAGAQCPVEDVEAVCEGLAAQQHFLDDTGLTVWPDGTSGGRYRFQHALYQQVLYEQLGTARRDAAPPAHWRAAGGGVWRPGGGDRRPARRPLRARRARSSGPCTIGSRRGTMPPGAMPITKRSPPCSKGLALLATLPESPERTQHELTLQLTLGELLMAAQGRGGSGSGRGLHPGPHAVPAGGGDAAALPGAPGPLAVSYDPGAVARRWRVGQQLFDLAQRQPDTGLVLEGHLVMGTVALYRGDFVAARAHLEHSCRLADTLPSPAPLFRGGLVSWGHHLRLAGAGPVGVGLCRPGPAAESGGAGPGPAGGAYPQSGVCGILCGASSASAAETWRRPRRMPTR